MRERIRPTGSGLFAIELLIAIGVFTLCAAVCVSLFVHAEMMSRESADLTRAVNEARNVCECFRAAAGDLDRTAALSGGRMRQTALLLSYDSAWNRIDEAHERAPAFQIQLLPRRRNGYTAATVQVSRSDGVIMLTWNVAALEAA